MDGLRGRGSGDRSFEFMTVHLVYGLFVARRRESVSFTVSASDLELISHGPLLEFHTPESSHDPGLAAQARPRPQGPAILFHMGYTHLILAGEKFIHTHVHTHTKHDTQSTHMLVYIH